MLHLLSLILSLSPAWADCTAGERAKSVGNTQKRLELLRTNAALGSVEQTVERWRASVAKCGETFESLGVNEAEVSQLLKVGYLSEAELWRTKAEHYSQYRAVGPELERYREAVVKAGGQPGKVQAFIQDNSARGLASVQRVKRSCTPQNFAAKMGPVRDQGSMGWCYAFTGADLISAPTGQRVSALGGAIAYNEDHPVWEGSKTKTDENGQPRAKDDHTGMTQVPFYDRTGGSTLLSMQSMKSRGVCLEEDLNSEDNGFGWLYENLKAVEELKNSERTAPQCTNGFAAAQNLFPGLQAKSFSKILEHGKGEQLISGLAQAACKPRIQVDLEFKEVLLAQSSKAQLFENLDEQLNNQNPVGISYDPAFMKNADNFSPTATHASSVVGRRYNEQSGECEYMIRNSWGRGCAGYVYPCEEGNIWVPQGALARSLNAVQYIK